MSYYFPVLMVFFLCLTGELGRKKNVRLYLDKTMYSFQKHKYALVYDGLNFTFFMATIYGQYIKVCGHLAVILIHDC